jgi:hypothetical protein
LCGSYNKIDMDQDCDILPCPPTLGISSFRLSPQGGVGGGTWQYIICLIHI